MLNTKNCWSQWVLPMENGDTAVCFSGNELERLTIKMIRFDSLASACRWDAEIISNLERQKAITDKVLNIERKEVRKYKLYFRASVGTGIILLILAVVF